MSKTFYGNGNTFTLYAKFYQSELAKYKMATDYRSGIMA